MKLKRYADFIKESLTTRLDKGGDFWELSNELIEDIFIDFFDQDWELVIERGFNVGVDEPEFGDIIKIGDRYKPSYWINLEAKKEASDVDLTGHFKDSLKRLEDYSNGEIIGLYNNDWTQNWSNHQYNIDDLLIKGAVIEESTNSDSRMSNRRSSINIFICEKKEIEVDEKTFIDYYNIQLEDSEFESLNKGLFVHVDLGTLVYKLIKGDYWEKTITDCDYYEGPINDFYDNYLSEYYTPDFISLIGYDLNKENLDLLIKAIIKENGGVDEIKRHIGDELDNEIYENIKDLDLEGLVKFFKSERFYNSLKHFTIESEIYNVVNYIVAGWGSSAHADQNYKEMMSEFDNIVEKEFSYNRKFREERVYKSNFVDGKKVDYKHEMTIYEIEFQNEWLQEYEFYDLDGKKLYDIFYEYISNLYYYEFEPSFSDYGDVDSNKMNAEIKSSLLNSLK